MRQHLKATHCVSPQIFTCNFSQDDAPFLLIDSDIIDHHCMELLIINKWEGGQNKVRGDGKNFQKLIRRLF